VIALNPNSYETVLKYEVSREKTFKKVGIIYSPSKVWKLLETKKNHEKTLDLDKILERLNISHDHNFKMRKFIEELFALFENFTRNTLVIMEGAKPVPHPPTLKAQDLGQVFIRDLEKFRELDEKEEKMLEIYTSEFLTLEKEVNFLIADLQDKFLSLQNQSFSNSNFSQKNSEDGRFHDLLDTCHEYSEQIQELKSQLLQASHALEKLQSDQDNSYYLDLISKLEGKVHEITKDLAIRDKRIEKLAETVKFYEEKNIELEKELEFAGRNSERGIKDQVSDLENQINELNRLLGVKNNDLEETLDNLRYLQEELAVYKYRKGKRLEKAESSDNEINELRSFNADLKEKVQAYKEKLNDVAEELISYKNQCIEYREENLSLKVLAGERKDDRSQQVYKNVLDQVKDMIQAISEKYANDWKNTREDENDYERIFTDIQFLKNLLSKMAFDNNWLVDQLEELGQENMKLKENSVSFFNDSFSEFPGSSIKKDYSKLSYKTPD
jgi:chromosome segregation ATPase